MTQRNCNRRLKTYAGKFWGPKTIRNKFYVVCTLHFIMSLSPNQQTHKIINKYKMYLQPLHLTAEARLRSRVSPCGICDGQSGTGTSFFPSTSVFPCHFHSTGAPLLGKTKKQSLSSSSSQGCTISLKAAVGP
jgi:hypothetical protein